MKFLTEMLDFVERAITYRIALSSLFLLLSLDVAMLATLHQNVLQLKLSLFEGPMELGATLGVITAFSGVLCLVAPTLWWLIELATLFIKGHHIAKQPRPFDSTNWKLESGFVTIDVLWDAAVREQSAFKLGIASDQKVRKALAQERKQLSIHISICTTVLLVVDTFAFGDASIARTALSYLGYTYGGFAALAIFLLAAGRWILAISEIPVGPYGEDDWVRYPPLAAQLLEQRKQRRL